MDNAFYRTKRWKLKREKILKRDKYLCQYFSRYGKLVEAEHVHHIYPAEFYPEYALCDWNLISLSTKAHNLMHDRDTHELTAEGLKLQKRVQKLREAYDAAHTPPPAGEIFIV